MGASVLGKARNDWSWGPLQEGPGQCLGERVGANPLNNFAFFSYKTCQNDVCYGEYRVENISNHSVVTLNTYIFYNYFT